MKKKLLFLSVAPLLLSSLIGCGGKSDAQGPDTYQYDVTMDTRGAEITMWTGFGSDMSKVLEERLAEFTKLTGITVKHESKSGYPNLLKAINLSSTSGSYPNVANGYPDHFASYVKSNILLRLDGFLANDSKRGEVDGAYTKDGHRFGADKIKLMNYEDFYKDYTLENETLEFKEDGTGYKLGVPFNKSTEVMVYNYNLFGWAAGALKNDVTGKTISVSGNDAWKSRIYVPTTWADVKSVGLAIRDLCEGKFMEGETAGQILSSDGKWYTTTAEAEANNHVVVLNLTAVEESLFKPFTYDAQANFVISLIRQYGGQFTEVDKTTPGKGYAVFNNATTNQALTMMQDLFDSNVLGIPDTYGELYCSTPFKSYKSVMNISSTAGLSNITSDAIMTKCAPIPSKDLGENKAVISQGTSLGMFDKGTAKERVAAWKLICFLSQQDNGAFAAQTGYFPTGEYPYNSIEYQQYLENEFKSSTDILRQASASVNSTEYVGKNWNKFVDPGFRGSADIREAVELIPGYLMTHTYSSVQETLDEVCKTIADYIKK